MPDLSQHACFRCRKVYKKPHEYLVSQMDRLCPQCGEKMVYMGYKFRAPRKAETKEWSRIEMAIREGKDYGYPKKVEAKPAPKISPKLLIALGAPRRRKPPYSRKKTLFGSSQ